MRDLRDLSSQRLIVPALIVGLMAAVTVFVGWRYGAGVGNSGEPIVVGALALALIYIIFRHPYLGLGLILALLPITDVISKLPFVSVLSPVIGGATLVAFLAQRRRMGMSLFPKRFYLTYALGFLFIFWIFISNPDAALRSGRGVAMFTYFQLYVLLWMGGELMVKSKNNQRLMWVFVIACLIASWATIQNASMGLTFDTEGTAGLGGLSSSARQFTAAFIILFYLRASLQRGTQRLLIAVTWIAQIMLIYGVSLTGSRTGILIVVIGLVIVLLNPTSKIRPQRVIIPAIIAFTIYSVVPSTYWDSMWNSIFPTLESGTDTVAIRYELWSTAMRMVADKPLTGVGINQFIPNVRAYSDPLSSTVVVVGAHSIYFSILAETGVIGFVLFMGAIVLSIFYALRAAWSMKNQQNALLAYVWFAVLAIILIGGITKHDQYDKLLWFALGACTAMETMRYRESEVDRQEQNQLAMQRRLADIGALPRRSDLA